MPLQTDTATITAAAAVLVTDRYQHLPPRPLAPPRKQLSHMSALTRVSYRGHVSGEGTNVEYRRRCPPLYINALRVELVSVV